MYFIKSKVSWSIFKYITAINQTMCFTQYLLSQTGDTPLPSPLPVITRDSQIPHNLPIHTIYQTIIIYINSIIVNILSKGLNCVNNIWVYMYIKVFPIFRPEYTWCRNGFKSDSVGCIRFRSDHPIMDCLKRMLSG